ncbi:hypothetical protein ECANGB1_2786 [Enterospora canceri]|uniref:RING-type domain-containing protein n=1 Tax=Enterospora canceri TaxID=1081671 RepID=A0A1Y1S8D8_9MICR|nr:hypothetical protein ECANGB1_2786 [Enterospora canceri]
MFLKCNNMQCRADIKYKYCITECKHLFCGDCVLLLERKERCIRCKSKIDVSEIRPKKFVKLDLRGYSIGYIHDMCKVATDFFLAQVVQEMRLMSSNRNVLMRKVREMEEKPVKVARGQKKERRRESNSSEEYVRTVAKRSRPVRASAPKKTPFVKAAHSEAETVENPAKIITPRDISSQRRLILSNLIKTHNITPHEPKDNPPEYTKFEDS